MPPLLLDEPMPPELEDAPVVPPAASPCAALKSPVSSAPPHAPNDKAIPTTEKVATAASTGKGTALVTIES